MEPEDINLLIQEFSDSSDRWTDLSLQSLTRTFDQGIRNADREFNLFLSLTSLCAAFLAIVVPLLKDALSGALIVAIILFFLTTAIGLVILILTIKRDGRVIIEDGKWEHSILQRYLNLCMGIRGKLYDFKKTPSDSLWIEINDKVKSYFESRKDLNPESESRKIEREKEPSAIALKYLKKFFWAMIVFSFISIGVWLAILIFSTASNPQLNTVPPLLSGSRNSPKTP